MGKQKRYWWITMSATGHFRTLEVKGGEPKEGEIYNDKWQNCLFFETEAEAQEMCDKIKNLIMEEYPRAKVQNWFK